MHYPRALHDEIEAISEIISRWPKDIDVSIDDVINWVLQFDEPDFLLALRVIKNINVLGQKDIDRGLRVAFSKLSRKAIQKDARINQKNTLYAAMGNIGKSGAMISYHFRMNTEISEENFLTDETIGSIEAGYIQNIVLIDDIIGTGIQATDEINNIASTLIPLGIKNIFVLTVCGMREAIEQIEKETKAYTFSAFEYSAIDTVSSLDSNFYKGIAHNEREEYKRKLAEYGAICYKKQPLGFGGIGSLIVMPYNTPNNTIPILWSDDNNWIPLFRRVRRVNGISAYQSQFKRAANKKTKEDHNSEGQQEAAALTIFVEGKIDEMFFDAVNKFHNLSELIGVEKVDIVSVGVNFPFQANLVKLLSDVMKRAVFITDGESRIRKKTQALLEQSKFVILLSPSCLAMLDKNKVIEILSRFDESIFKIDIEASDEVFFFELENIIKSRTPERMIRLIQILVERCMDFDKLIMVTEDISERIGVREIGVNNTSDQVDP